MFGKYIKLSFVLLVLALVAVNLKRGKDNVHRSLCRLLLQEYPLERQRRKLAAAGTCMAYWPEGTGPMGFWESRFQPIEHTEDVERVWPSGMKNVAYVVSFMYCPDAESKPAVDSQYDAEGAFFDAASLLKHSICENSNANELSGSYYGDTIYAMLHPDAVTCKGSNGITYDRARLLQSLGYWVKIWQGPVALQNLVVTQPHIYKNIENDVGLRDLMKLNSLLLKQHELVVLLDLTVFVMKPLDEVFNTLRSSNKKAAYVLDPETGGVSTSMLIMKTDAIDFDELIDSYKNIYYDEVTGWGRSNIGLNPGGMGTSGLLTYYFSNNKESTTELDACIYLNSANPQCLTTNFDSLIGIRLTDSVCDQPWKCSYNDKIASWDTGTKKMCDDFFIYWTEARYHYESIHWSKRTESDYNNGTYHMNIYTGYCSGPGVDGYIPMIRNKEPTLEVCQTETYVGCEVTDKTPAISLAGGTELELFVSEPKDCSVIIAEPGGEGAIITFTGTTETRLSTKPVKDTSMVFVIDRSGSTCDAKQLGCVSNENYDMQYDDVLDCEIAAILDLVSKIRDEGTVSQIGLISFRHALGDVTGATIELPLENIDLLDHARVHSIDEAIREIECGGSTNYAEAVKLACQVIDQSATENNVVVFLSDGKPTESGIIEKFCDNDAVFHTIALGSESICDSDYSTSLQTISDSTYGTCQEVGIYSEIGDIIKGISDVTIDENIRASVSTHSIGIDYGCNDVPNWSLFGVFDCPHFTANPKMCAFLGDTAAGSIMGHTSNTACCACGGGESYATETRAISADQESTSITDKKVDYSDSMMIPPGEIELCTTVTAKSAGVRAANVQCKKVYVCPHPSDGIPG